MKIRAATSFLIVSLLWVSSYVHADAVRDANRLLRVTNMGSRFESTALQQTREIIRTYASIVNMSVDITLPQQIKNSIADCYAEVYAWEHFQAGIARILADNLSQKELRLLTDFYSDRGLPPMEIDTFKRIVAKADHIQRISADYIFANSDSCVQRDAELIQDYLSGATTISPELVTIE